MNILEDEPAPGGGAGGSWYHVSVKTVSRGAGRSAVAAAAYRLGEELRDEKTGITHNYARRSGVVDTCLLAPEGAPEWAFDPERFWNAAEAAEKRKDSRVAREVELALPDALAPNARKDVALGLARYLVDRYQVGVTVAIHEPGKGDDRNHHAHLLFSTRRLGPDGFGAKTRELDDKTQGAAEITAIRQHAALLINEALERAGRSDERVDERSFKDRGIARAPTEHLGPSAHQLERKGKGSRKGDRNREIKTGNQQVAQIVVDLAALEAELQQVQEALLDERYGPPETDAPASPHSAEPPAAAPAWFAELREPLPPLTPPEVETLMHQAAAPYLAQIQAQGSLDDGAPDALRWHERIALHATRLWQQAGDWTRGAWQSLVAHRRARPDLEREGPDREK